MGDYGKGIEHLMKALVVGGAVGGIAVGGAIGWLARGWWG